MSRKVYQLVPQTDNMDKLLVDRYGGYTTSPLDEAYETSKTNLQKEIKYYEDLLSAEIGSTIKLKIVYEGYRYCSVCDEYYWADDGCYC